MTVGYSFASATSGYIGSFHKLLFRWKGSVWKAVWQELLIWCILYAILSITYRCFLIKEHRETFEDLCIFFDKHSTFIPVTFMLGFYVSVVYGRWWQVFDNMGWIDQPSLQITQSIRGRDERSKILRRNVIRYMILMEAMVLRDISSLIRKRFPTLQHLVASGLMTEHELEMFEAVKSPHSKYWLPIQWLYSLITLAKDEGRIQGEYIYVALIDRIAIYRAKLINLVLYDWVCIPLVYTQVVHLAVYSFFFTNLFARQYLEREGVKKSIDLYVPILSILQFIFILGWLKVAQVLLNGLGEDDDDFEMNWVIDRNFQVGISVEECYDQYPPIIRDVFWDTPDPEPLYTVESAKRPINPQVGSCVNMKIPKNSSFMVRPRRSTLAGSTLSVWDGQIDSNYVKVKKDDKLEPDPLKHSVSTSSMSNFINKIKRSGRRMSTMSLFAMARKRTISNERRCMESPDMLSSISSLERCDYSFPHLNGQQTPPAFNVTPPTPAAVPTSAEECRRRNPSSPPDSPSEEYKEHKRHSAPDALEMTVKQPEESRRNSKTSSGLPIIFEDSNEKSRRQSDASNIDGEEGNDADTIRAANNRLFKDFIHAPQSQHKCVCNKCNKCM
ncbi:unnamed protein product [Cylicocyclus nassatus]|uniref:Bestrophin homolog n=1 Tax=Cylicocyclus nassatus TaxID=53992 RepID=A0AA36HC22_CYLNA|nr:unnamed protein product [Cylicocyclus nassatus]